MTLKTFRGYVRTLRNYFRTDKARHDLCDYARAVGLILLTALIVALILRRWTA